MPIDLRLLKKDESEREVEMSEYLKEKVKNLEQIWVTVKNNLEKAQMTQKHFSDLEPKVREHEFEVHDLVLLKIEHLPHEQHHKFKPKWKGPYRIVNMKGPVVTIKDLANLNCTEIVHMNRLKKLTGYSTTPLKIREQ
jgi:hypothetical protein